MNVGVPLIFFHYGERAHIDQFFVDGSIQIGTVQSYDCATHGQMIGDDHEGLSWDVITDDNVRRYRESGREIETGPLGIPMFLAPGSRGNVQIIQNVSFNYAMFCTTYILHKSLCQNFKPTYDAAIMIERPFPFYYELTKAFIESGLRETVTFQHVSDVQYQNRILEPGIEVIEALIKDPGYRHQAEVRALWNAGNYEEHFFRFKAPNAVRCCRKILLENMPDYSEGASYDECKAMMEHALRTSTPI